MKEITQIRKLSLWVFFTPLLAINLCLLISQNPEFLENTFFTVDQLGRSGFSIPYLDGSLSIPEKMTFGVGIGKNKQDRSTWDLAFQYEIRDWTTFQESNSIESWTSPQLGTSNKMSFGFRWTPNLDFANSSKSIFSKSA